MGYGSAALAASAWEGSQGRKQCPSVHCWDGCPSAHDKETFSSLAPLVVPLRQQNETAGGLGHPRMSTLRPSHHHQLLCKGKEFDVIGRTRENWKLAVTVNRTHSLELPMLRPLSYDIDNIPPPTGGGMAMVGTSRDLWTIWRAAHSILQGDWVCTIFCSGYFIL